MDEEDKTADGSVILWKWKLVRWVFLTLSFVRTSRVLAGLTQFWFGFRIFFWSGLPNRCFFVKPLLKKIGLELILKNYRPVSNLSFLSKLVEKSAVIQAHNHMNQGKLLPEYQSAYRENFSTETALVKLCNDILENMEHRKVTVLCAIDLSAAFDTVDHDILLATKHLKTSLDFMEQLTSGLKVTWEQETLKWKLITALPPPEISHTEYLREAVQDQSYIQFMRVVCRK